MTLVSDKALIMLPKQTPYFQLSFAFFPHRIIVGRGQWPVVALGVLTVTVVAGVRAGCPADVAPSGQLPRGFLPDLLWCVLPGAVLQWRGKAGQQHE